MVSVLWDQGAALSVCYRGVSGYFVRPRVSSLDSNPATIGRYEVLRTLGQGAMGRVMLARDPVLNREVAIKVLRDDLGIPPDLRDNLLVRMRHEAQAAARVSHPNLVTLHDMGEDGNVGLYLVFEYVDGPNLKERLRAGRLPPLQAARLARELGNALAVAHLAGVLHRDVKPENVMLAASGAKISDFGIAKIPDSTLTRQGSLIGTPAYSAPEALSRASFSPESDQFSLAATLYEATSGERAFPGDDAAFVAARIQTDDPKTFAKRLGLPEEIDAILLRALSKDPEQRFASTAEFGETLAAALERTFVAQPRVPSVPLVEVTLARPPVTPSHPEPTRIAIGAATIALVSGLVGYAASQGAPLFPGPRIPPSVLTSASASPSVEPSAPPRPTSPPVRARASASAAPPASTSSSAAHAPSADPPRASSSAPSIGSTLPPLP